MHTRAANQHQLSHNRAQCCYPCDTTMMWCCNSWHLLCHAMPPPCDKQLPATNFFTQTLDYAHPSSVQPISHNGSGLHKTLEVSLHFPNSFLILMLASSIFFLLNNAIASIPYNEYWQFEQFKIPLHYSHLLPSN